MPFSMKINDGCILDRIRIQLLRKLSVYQNLRTPLSQMKNYVTLQVRILHEKRMGNSLCNIRGKKAFPSASFRDGFFRIFPGQQRVSVSAGAGAQSSAGGMFVPVFPQHRNGGRGFKPSSGRQSLAASLTLEAALGLSLFIFAAVCMLLPMRIMNTERKLQAAMESMGEEFSRYAYIKDAVEHSKPLSAAGTGDFAKAFCQHLVSGAAQGYGMVQVKEHVDTRALERMTMGRTQIMEEGEMIRLVLDYEIRLPFPVLGLPALQRTTACSRRAWVGLPGKTYDEDGNRTDDPDEIVYIGKNSTRYHRSRECHYLSNKLKSVALASIEGERNQSGARYSPCAVCGSQAGAYVYIMPSGTSYHSSAVCRAILAYVKAVRLSEVEHLGACSYCGK